MAHRVEFQIGLDDDGQYDPDAWSRRYTGMHRWALDRCGGPERFTITSRREVVDGSAREILIYCFESSGDAEDFRRAFFDKRRG